MTAMAPPHPLVAENLDAFNWNIFYALSLQTLFDGFCQGYQAIRRDEVCISQKEDVIKTFSFFILYWEDFSHRLAYVIDANSFLF